LLTEFALAVPQPTEWQRIGNQIDAAMIFARSDFVLNASSNFLQAAVLNIGPLALNRRHIAFANTQALQ
jgi:hypothetical protein